MEPTTVGGSSLRRAAAAEFQQELLEVGDGLRHCGMG
jgi:hypothetical protein